MRIIGQYPRRHWSGVRCKRLRTRDISSQCPLLMAIGSITNYNLVISVLSMFIMLVKGIMFITRVFPPLLSALIHAALTALYAYSVHGQVSKDLNDPEHPQNGPPWYITKSCSATFNPANVGYCQQAKATFAITIIMLYAILLRFLRQHKTY